MSKQGTTTSFVGVPTGSELKFHHISSYTAAGLPPPDGGASAYDDADDSTSRPSLKSANSTSLSKSTDSGKSKKVKKKKRRAPVSQGSSSEPTAKATEIQFSVLGNEEVVRMSHLEVVEKQLYELNTREPVTNGPLDRRLGMSDKRSTCATCGQGLTECMGHFGHVRLAMPCFHIGFFKETYRAMTVLCPLCARVKLPVWERAPRAYELQSEELEKNARTAMLKEIAEMARKQRVCPHCRRPSGLVKKYPSLLKMYLDFSHKDFMGLREEFQARFKMPMQFSDVVDKDMTKRAHVDIDAQFVFQLFDALDDRDVYLLGMNPRVSHPRDMIVRMLPVPPVCIRPSVAMGAAGSNEDDLTVKIRDIIFISETLRRRMEVCHDVASIMESWDFLQSQVAMLINADMPGLAQNPNKKQIRSLTQRLKGKAGRFRAHLSGKRVDFSGRTVISPDPNLRIDEVGVPNRVAKSLTFPETVNSFNIARLRAAVRNGPDRYPGANYVMISNGHRLNLRYARSVDLEFGDVVERHLVDGDVVLFNRQPSLHRMSIMAHRVRVMPWRTFRFNECVCNPYNADFDGDEMNLHVPQTQEARAEALLLMSVKRNIVSPRHGEILVCAIQDFITAAYLLSKRDVFYDRARFQQIACMMNDADEPVVLPPPAIVKPVSLWTGKQVLSLLLRPNSDPRWPKIFLDTASRSFNEADLADGEDNVMHARDGWVVVRHSVLLAGVLDKGTLGGSKNGLLYAIMRDYGTDAAAVFLNRLAKLCARWLGERGFSIGIDDVTPSPALLNEKRKLILAGYINCDELIKSFEGDKLPASPGMTAEETLEAKCLSSLSQIRNSAGNICLETLSFNHNAPLIMAVCGSKGSKINISQMVSCVGQQAVGGARIQNGFVDRTLPHFEHLSRKPDAKGFVANSFFSGLNPTEFFFHTMGGREGLVDTAVKTAETGYMQRRLMKSMEDLCTHYDGSVRSSDGRVIQLSFGDDGLDPVCMAGKDGPVDFEAVAVSVLLAERSAKPAPGDMDVDDEEEDDVPLDDLWLQRWTDHKRLRLWKRCCAPAPLGLCYLQPVETQRADLCFDEPSPVELAERVLYCEIEHEVMDASTGGTAEQREARRHVAEWHLTRAVSDRFLDQLVAWINKVTAHVTDSDRSFSYTFPTTRREFITVVSSIFAKYEAARVEAGTAVGAIGAQSIGEPGTQMTLKTFHFAGVASMNVTLGVPRIKEIINATKNISSPIVEAPLLRNIRRKLSKVRATKSRIEETRLRDIADTFTFTVANNLAVLSVKLSTDRIKLLHLEGAVTPYFIAEQLTRMRTKHKFPGYIRARTERMRIDCILDTGALLNAASTDGHCYVEAHREISRMQKFLENVIVAGIPGIRRVVVADTAGDGSPDPDDSEDEEKRDDDDEGDVKMEKAGKEEAPEDAKMEDAEEEEKEPLGGPYKLFVEGNELLSVMGVEGVDGRRCKSNHIVEMYNVLGIEAARQSIIDQIRDTMAGHGLSVDPRHLALLADTMTYTGEILGITRFGISKMKNSVLMLASFEKTADHLFEAAYRGYREPIQGVTESIVLGNPVPLGTGSVHLMHKFADVDEEAQGMPDAQGGE